MNQIAKQPTMTVQRLKEHLAERPTQTEVVKLLAPIFTAFPTSAGSDNAANKVRLYSMAIEDIAPWATRLAVKDFIKGNVPEHDGRFLPTPAQLAKRARAIRDEKSAREYKRIASQSESKPDPKPMTEAEMQRRRDQVAALVGPGFLEGEQLNDKEQTA